MGLLEQGDAMTCFFCGGAAHPATGHRYTVNVLACRRCYEHFFRWYRARMRSNPIAHAAMKEVK